jgi:ankyrin repeat protein
MFLIIDILHSRDENGWQAIHEAVRGGHIETVKYLIDMGSDIAARTNNGASLLWWAIKLLGPANPSDPVIVYLTELKAPILGDNSS